MHHYRCRFTDKEGAPSDWLPLRCESDGEAHGHALGLFAVRPLADKVEVWAGKRITLSYSHRDEASPAELRRLCYLAIAAAKKETDPETKRTIAAGAFMLAQQAQVLERSVDCASNS